ncbi:MAG: hypothetical protein ABI193_10170, partial [Minicystis sp.]
MQRAVFLVSSLGLVAAAIAGCSLAFEPSGTSVGAGGASSSSGTGAGPTATGTVTSSSTGSGDGGITDFFGVFCGADSDCGSALVCVKATDDDAIFGGGPAGGLCTRVCDADTDCPGTSSTCLQAGGGQPGRCALTCTLGPKLGDLQEP